MKKERNSENLESFTETKVKDRYKNTSFTIILVQPESAGNIGSIARTMKNFNFTKLVIFNPIEELAKITDNEAQGFAMHAADILFNAEIIMINNQENHIIELKKYLAKFDLIIASTSKGMKYSNIRRTCIFPMDLEIPINDKKQNIAIVFGKESTGLTNEEIALADILIRIPTNNEYPTMNLSHALAIILFEIFKKISILNMGRGKKPVRIADKADRVSLYHLIKQLIQILKTKPPRSENIYLALKNVFERSIMSKKELSLIMGLFSKLNLVLKDEEFYTKIKFRSNTCFEDRYNLDNFES